MTDMTDTHKLVEAMARAIWVEREKRLPERVQRRRPDRIDVVSGALANVEDEARAALRAIEASGYRVVPVGMTDEMLYAACDPLMGFDRKWTSSTEVVPSIWAAALAAASKVATP